MAVLLAPEAQQQFSFEDGVDVIERPDRRLGFQVHQVTAISREARPATRLCRSVRARDQDVKAVPSRLP